jgi:toxoflavin synthase
VKANTEFKVEFDVFQFRKQIYERCAKEAGLVLQWRDAVVPEDGRKDEGYWARWLERPTFVIVEARKI